MHPASFGYQAPGSLEEAFGLLQEHGEDGKLLAGGHSLIPAMKLRLTQPEVLIDLRHIPGLIGIREDGQTLVIGALTTHTEVATSETVRRLLPGLADTASVIASYAKLPHPASGYVVVSAAAALSVNEAGACTGARLVLGGVAGTPHRATGAETSLAGQELTPDVMAAAAARAADGIDPHADSYADEEYKRHMAVIYARRAIEAAAARE